MFSDYTFYAQDDMYSGLWNEEGRWDYATGDFIDWSVGGGVDSNYSFDSLYDNYGVMNSGGFDSYGNWSYDNYLTNTYTYSEGSGFTYNYDFNYAYGDYGSYDYYGYDSFYWSMYPVVLDLDDDGVELTSVVDSTAWFDVAGDGARHQTGWVGKDDALLAYDENGDGQITTASEIAFASRTTAIDTDLEALRAEFDSNRDGKLDAKDKQFSKFRIWQDKDSDELLVA